MNSKRTTMTCCFILLLGSASALAGPCDSRAAKDAGSGPARMSDSQTTGTAGSTGQHAPTNRMNKSTDDVATSSQDSQRQMQGQPTAAQQAEGAKADRKTAGNDC